jgi:hypothetical protein
MEFSGTLRLLKSPVLECLVWGDGESTKQFIIICMIDLTLCRGNYA